MDQTDIPLTTELPPSEVVAIIEECCSRAGLTSSLRGSLRSYPGSTHWHYRQIGRRGTLEITYWPPKRRLWITIRAARSGDWTAGSAATLCAEITACLQRATCP